MEIETGNKIPRELCAIMSEYMTVKEADLIATTTGLSRSTVMNLMDGRQNITKNNKIAVVGIIAYLRKKLEVVRDDAQKHLDLITETLKHGQEV